MRIKLIPSLLYELLSNFIINHSCSQCLYLLVMGVCLRLNDWQIWKSTIWYRNQKLFLWRGDLVMHYIICLHNPRKPQVGIVYFGAKTDYSLNGPMYWKLITRFFFFLPSNDFSL